MLSLIIAVAVAGCAKRGTNLDEAIAANKELDKRFLEAFKRKDLDAMMSCWWRSHDAVMYPSDDIDGRKGWEAINASVKFMVDGTDSIISAELMETSYSIRGDAVIGTGKLAMIIKPKGSTRPVELVSRFTDIREMKDGKWVYVYSHESMNPMAAFGSQQGMR
jgi:ketosteroid isomerase-like protein